MKPSGKVRHRHQGLRADRQSRRRECIGGGGRHGLGWGCRTKEGWVGGNGRGGGGKRRRRCNVAAELCDKKGRQREGVAWRRCKARSRCVGGEGGDRRAGVAGRWVLGRLGRKPRNEEGLREPSEQHKTEGLIALGPQARRALGPLQQRTPGRVGGGNAKGTHRSREVRICGAGGTCGARLPRGDWPVGGGRSTGAHRKAASKCCERFRCRAGGCGESEVCWVARLRGVTTTPRDLKSAA